MAYSTAVNFTYTGATNGANVTTSNSNFTGSAGGAIAPGASSTITFSNSSVFNSSLFVRCTQGGTSTPLVFLDHGAGLTDFGASYGFRFQTLPSITSLNFLRHFDGISGAGANIMSVAVTSTGKLSGIETSGGVTVQSTGSLAAGTWYCLVERYVGSTGAYTLTAYAAASLTATASISITMATGYPFRSTRLGAGTASSGIGYVDFSDGQVGTGGVPPRLDVAVSAPTVTAGATQDPSTGVTITVTASAGVSGDTVASLTGAFTTLPSGVTAPTLTGSATGTGTASAALSQTFTAATPGWYVWTATGTGTSSGLSTTATTALYISPVAGAAVPVRSVTSVGYVNVGGAASLAAALTDANDATFAESPSSPTAASYIDTFMGPYPAIGIKFNPKLVKSGSDPMTVTVECRKSNQSGVATGAAIYTTPVTVTGTASTPDVILDGTALAALATADRREICWRVYGVV